MALSLYICYYLRFPSSKLRQAYIAHISNVLPYIIEFEKIFQEESLFITKQVLSRKKDMRKTKVYVKIYFLNSKRAVNNMRKTRFK